MSIHVPRFHFRFYEITSTPEILPKMPLVATVDAEALR